MNLVSGDSLRGAGDLKALWEAHMLYIASPILGGNYVSTKTAPLMLWRALPIMHQDTAGCVCTETFFYCEVVKEQRCQKKTIEREIKEEITFKLAGCFTPHCRFLILLLGVGGVNQFAIRRLFRNRWVIL